MVKLTSTAKLLAILLASAVISSCASFSGGDDFPDTTINGLERIQDSQVQAAYLKPGVDLSKYDSFMVQLAQVTFDENWERDVRQNSASRIAMSESDKQRIISQFSELFLETFTEVLSEGGDYNVVNQAGPSVLGVRMWVTDLYISAPDVNQAARTRSYVANAGSMVLVGELFDTTSGDVVAQFADARAARDEVFLTWSSSSYNRQEARRMFRNWAGLLKDGMDEIHGR